MLTYTLEKGSGKSLYAALYEYIREDIRAGRLTAGTRLPSKRALSANLGVSVATVENAYAQLIAEGYAESRERSGVYVCAIGASVRPMPGAFAVPSAQQAEKPLFDLSGGSGVERAPAHLGAEGAGILLVPVVEDDGADEGAAHLIGNIVSPEQRFQRGVIHRLAAKLGVEGDGHDFERKAEVLPQPRETDGQSLP